MEIMSFISNSRNNKDETTKMITLIESHLGNEICLTRFSIYCRFPS